MNLQATENKYAGWTQNQLMSERKRIQHQLRDARIKGADLDLKKEALEDVIAWAESDPQLQRNECSRLHKLLEAMKAGRIMKFKDETTFKEEDADVLKEDNHVFVVKHDWLSVLGDENLPTNEEFKLPYPLCTFEFRISNRTVVVICAQDETQTCATGFIEMRNGVWFTGESSDSDRASMRFAWKHVLAACTVIDAEVATHHVTRASSSLNKKREEAGKIPLFDFHTIDLSHRHRVSAAKIGEGTKKRLHFRRGHWRHYEAHKTWIRWCLVGDPALGFVDKDYSL